MDWYSHQKENLKKDFYIEGEYVAKETTDNKEVEAEGCYVIPGLVDIHFHGCVRHDMCDGTEESIQAPLI